MEGYLKSIFDYLPSSIQKKRNEKDRDRDAMLANLAPGEPANFDSSVDEVEITYKRGPPGGGGKAASMKRGGGSGGGGDIEDVLKPKSMFRKRVM